MSTITKWYIENFLLLRSLTFNKKGNMRFKTQSLFLVNSIQFTSFMWSKIETWKRKKKDTITKPENNIKYK